MKRLLVGLLIVSWVTSARAAESNWLPPQMADAVAHQLAERMTRLGAGGDETALLARARRMVDAIREQIDRWGAEGTLRHSPRFPGIDVPVNDNPQLDAMGRYQICNAVLFRQLQDPAFSDDQNAMITSTLGLTAVTMTIVRLRQILLDKGGSDEAIQAFLTSSAFEPLVQKIQTDLEVRAAVEQQCQPVVVDLLREALSSPPTASGGD